MDFQLCHCPYINSILRMEQGSLGDAKARTSQVEGGGLGFYPFRPLLNAMCPDFLINLPNNPVQKWKDHKGQVKFSRLHSPSN